MHTIFIISCRFAMIWLLILSSCQSNLEYLGTFKTMPLEEGELLVLEVEDSAVLPFVQPDSVWSYIMLEQTENSVLGDLVKVERAGSKWVVLDNQSQLLVFSNQGDYLFTVGVRGEGPGEYIRVDDFSVTPDQQYIWVLDPLERMICYSLVDGSFVKEGSIENEPGFGLHSISAISDSSFLVAREKFYSRLYPAEIMEVVNFEIRQSLLTKYIPKDTIFAGQHDFHFSGMKKDGFIFYTSIYTDTLFRINPLKGTYQPYFWMDWGKHQIQPADVEEAKLSGRYPLDYLFWEKKKFTGYTSMFHGDSYFFLSSNGSGLVFIYPEEEKVAMVAMLVEPDVLGFIQPLGMVRDTLIGFVSGEEIYKHGNTYFANIQKETNLSDNLVQEGMAYVKNKYPRWAEIQAKNKNNDNPILILTTFHDKKFTDKFLRISTLDPPMDFLEYVRPYVNKD